MGINLQGNMLEKPIVPNDEELFNTARDTAAIIGSFVDLNKKEQILVENAILDNWKKDRKLTYKNIAKATESWCDENNKKVPSELDLKLRRLKGQTILFSEKGITDITDIWKPGEVSVISLKKLSDKQKVFFAWFILRKLFKYIHINLYKYKWAIVMGRKTVSLSLDEETYEKYRKYCEDNHIILSRMVEDFMRKELKNHGRTK